MSSNGFDLGDGWGDVAKFDGTYDKDYSVVRDSFVDRRLSIAMVNFLNILMDRAALFLENRGILPHTEKYLKYAKTLDTTQVLSAITAELSLGFCDEMGISPECYPPPNKGFDKEREIYSAVLIIEYGEFLRDQIIFYLKNKTKIHIEEAAMWANNLGTIQVAYLTINTAGAWKKKLGKSQGDRRRAAGKRSKQAVQEAATTILKSNEGRHYRWHTEAQKGKVKVSPLAAAVMDEVGLSQDTVEKLLRKLIKEGGLK